MSVRLDDDGVASTRSPRDLVGQSFVSKNKGNNLWLLVVSGISNSSSISGGSGNNSKCW